MRDLIEKIAREIQAHFNFASLLQLIALAAIAMLSVWMGRRVRTTSYARAIEAQPGLRARFIEGLIIVSPHMTALMFTGFAVGLLLSVQQPVNLLATALTLIGLLAFIRAVVYLFRVSVGDRAPIKGWGTTISLVVWAALSLHVLDWLDPVAAALDSIGIVAGKTRISVWSVVKLLVTVSAFVVVAVWLSRWVEQRLMSAHAIAISMRIGLAKFAQAFLIGLSILLGLNAAGLDLTTLTVLTGAIGIGLGFGLQAIASNFVSGFVLLMDRSIKPGDVISLSGLGGGTPDHFGWVQELRGRYVVVRDRDGVETLVPNQHLITNPVINWSYADPRVRLHLPVRISYNDDPEKALLLLQQAAECNRRILRDPLPAARLTGFGDAGLELELRFWISDPQEGVNNVRSDVNRAIWQLFKENGITMPVAQREVVLHMGNPIQDAKHETRSV